MTEYERKLLVEGVKARIAVAREGAPGSVGHSRVLIVAPQKWLPDFSGGPGNVLLSPASPCPLRAISRLANAGGSKNGAGHPECSTWTDRSGQQAGRGWQTYLTQSVAEKAEGKG